MTSAYFIIFYLISALVAYRKVQHSTLVASEGYLPCTINYFIIVHGIWTNFIMYCTGFVKLNSWNSCWRFGGSSICWGSKWSWWAKLRGVNSICLNRGIRCSWCWSFWINCWSSNCTLPCSVGFCTSSVTFLLGWSLFSGVNTILQYFNIELFQYCKI